MQPNTLIQTIDLSKEKQTKLHPAIAFHLEWLEKESENHNLTRVPSELWPTRHVLDSLAPLYGGWKVESPLLDMGCGPGFPGVPLACQTESPQWSLVESKKKIANALEDFLHKAELSEHGKAFGERLEDLARNKEHRGRYKRVTTRALASLPTLLELGIPFLADGGELWCWKSDSDELALAEKALHELNAKFVRGIQYQLPKEEQARMVLAFTRIGNIPEKYPRRKGIPQKRPL